MKEQLQNKADRFYAEIEEMAEKLEYFQKNGLEQDRQGKLISHFTQWVNYAKVLTFRSGGTYTQLAER